MPSGTGFITRTVQTDQGDRKYSLFIPASYTPEARFPTIVFLHGLGESGRDGVRPRTVGLGPAIARRADTFDFIAIFPQVPGNWKASDAEQMAIRVLDDAQKHYSIDPQRISLSGLSTGGEGTWLIGAAHRQRFAALVPLCGYAAKEVVDQLTGIPIWAFHNRRDFVVAVSNTRDMVRAVEARGGHICYTEFHSLSHNCWDEAYANEELFDWLKQQRRSALSR